MRTTAMTIAALLSTSWGPVAAAAEPASACGARIPEALAAPAGTRPAFELKAVGVQIYACQAGAGAPTWALQAPEAALTEPGGAHAGTHGAGPSWTAADGSAVTGAKVAAVSVDAGAVPWLLLAASGHVGQGRMADVAFVQRVATSGGLAPATGCDAEHVGATVRVPYRATYCFHRAAR